MSQWRRYLMSFLCCCHDDNSQPLWLTSSAWCIMSQLLQPRSSCALSSQGRNFFFSVPTPAQLSAYANHEFKIILTPTQLSAYANHELKNWYCLAKVARRQTARAKYWSRAYAQLKRNIITDYVYSYHESTLQQNERRFFYICLAYAQNMRNHELNL